MRISDWSSDVCSSDLSLRRASDRPSRVRQGACGPAGAVRGGGRGAVKPWLTDRAAAGATVRPGEGCSTGGTPHGVDPEGVRRIDAGAVVLAVGGIPAVGRARGLGRVSAPRARKSGGLGKGGAGG